jgi:hypothetical protein
LKIIAAVFAATQGSSGVALLEMVTDFMAGEGFEPSKAEPTDLQSVPFDRSGIPPSGEEFRT